MVICLLRPVYCLRYVDGQTFTEIVGKTTASNARLESNPQNQPVLWQLLSSPWFDSPNSEEGNGMFVRNSGWFSALLNLTSKSRALADTGREKQFAFHKGNMSRMQRLMFHIPSSCVGNTYEKEQKIAAAKGEKDLLESISFYIAPKNSFKNLHTFYEYPCNYKRCQESSLPI
jgi:hypothetical protein